ncbi:class II aldolase/adducin family protein [Ponticaulis profundi]|uniref:Class II aldolase/adducin family protein n=1 Tax=Ponticaulis profundi TaxID=2665222 RepID=A0ABW1SFS2_9PROT
MADDLSIKSVQASVTPEEWQARVDLAALYRLTAYHGWDDLIFTHISLRVPGPEHHFLINPYGLLFEEITASSLVKVDLDGEIVSDTPYAINPAGFTIHSAVHAAREDAKCVMHLHTDQGVAVSAQKGGLLPISQTGMIAMSDLAYHDYEGIALDHDERERIVADLGNKHSMMLRNHGTLTCGESAAQTYMRMFFLERACKMQIMAQAGGELLFCQDDLQDKVAGQSNPKGMGMLADALAWPALLRRLDRNLPGYDV